MSTEDFKRLLIEETSIIKQMDMFNQAIWDLQTTVTFFEQILPIPLTPLTVKYLLTQFIIQKLRLNLSKLTFLVFSILFIFNRDFRAHFFVNLLNENMRKFALNTPITFLTKNLLTFRSDFVTFLSSFRNPKKTILHDSWWFGHLSWFTSIKLHILYF